MNCQDTIYAEVAPLPPAIVDHLLRRYIQARPNAADATALFIDAVREKRRDIFDVLDDFVRADALTRKAVREKLKKYDHYVADSTFTYWQQWGLIEKDGHGKIKPLSAQSILIAGMIDQGQREFLPSDGVPDGDTWRCYIQRHPQAEIEAYPAGKLDELPSSALCWTPMRSACWDLGWHLLGDGEGYTGCMRFAGIEETDRGQIWYNVTVDDIRRWNKRVADLYAPSPGNTLAPVQNLCRPLFDRLAVSRLGKRS